MTDQLGSTTPSVFRVGDPTLGHPMLQVGTRMRAPAPVPEPTIELLSLAHIELELQAIRQQNARILAILLRPWWGRRCWLRLKDWYGHQ